MSRVAKKPIKIVKDVSIKISGNVIEASGTKGSAKLVLHPFCSISQEGQELIIGVDLNKTKGSYALAGTMRALVNNLVIGVSTGFEKKLVLIGIGYRAKAQTSDTLDLQLGFSHPVIHKMPEGIICETPTQTEIIIKGVYKQVVGEVAAKIRAYRPPEPYKGKGVRYFDEVVNLKEVKKK